MKKAVLLICLVTIQVATAQVVCQSRRLPATFNNGHISSDLQAEYTNYYNIRSENGAGLSSNSLASDGQLVLLAADVYENTSDFNLFFYPNPFTEQTEIVYELQTNSSVEISLTDVLGRRIVLQPESDKTAGRHKFTLSKNYWNLSNGVYFLKMKLGRTEITRKIIIQ